MLLHNEIQFSQRLCLAVGWTEAERRFAAKQWPRLELLSPFGQGRAGNKAKACSSDWGLQVLALSCSLGEFFQNSQFFQAFGNWACPILGGRAEQPWWKIPARHPSPGLTQSCDFIPLYVFATQEAFEEQL